MILVNAISTSPAPAVPVGLKARLSLVTTCAFTEREVRLFSLAFSALDIALKLVPSPDPGIYATAIFTDTDIISIQEKDSTAYGHWMPVITYNLHPMRAANLTDLQVLTVALEEVCHCFGAIRDELLVEDKVVELLRLILPNVQKSDVYNQHWSQSDSSK